MYRYAVKKPLQKIKFLYNISIIVRESTFFMEQRFNSILYPDRALDWAGDPKTLLCLHSSLS